MADQIPPLVDRGVRKYGDRWTRTHAALLPIIWNSLGNGTITLSNATVKVEATLRGWYSPPKRTVQGFSPYRILGPSREWRVSIRPGIRAALSFKAFCRNQKMIALRSGSGRLFAKRMERATHRERMSAYRESLAHYLTFTTKPHPLGGNVVTADQTHEVVQQIAAGLISLRLA